MNKRNSFTVKTIISLFAATVFCASMQYTAAQTIATHQKIAVPYFQNHSCTPDSQRIGGKEFIRSTDRLRFLTRDSMIVEQVLAGNIPDSLKFFRKIIFYTSDSNSKHKVEMLALPDYLAVGTNEDFIRVPMGPVAAQQVADSLYCSLPTSKLVDEIAAASEGAIDPFPFRPVGDRNCQPWTFEDSNNAINALYKVKGYHFGQFISGLKKDVIISTLAEDTTKPCRVVIYGWHYPDGTHIQNSTNVHVNFYTDYSHGIRLIYRIIKIDGKEYDIQKVLTDPQMFRILSKEETPMKKATYAGDSIHQLLTTERFKEW